MREKDADNNFKKMSNDHLTALQRRCNLLQYAVMHNTITSNNNM